MKKLTKRLSIAKKQLLKDSYDMASAIKIGQDLATAKFVESMEAHISLNIDPKQANQQFRTSVVLPKGTGKEIKIAVLAPTEKHEEALNAGANLVGEDDLVNEISKGIINFDILITVPEMIPRLTTLGKILGPRKLMPSAKSGTVSTDLTRTIQSFKAGKIECRVDKAGIVHVLFGKANFAEEDLLENLVVIFNTIKQNKPIGVKSKYIKNFYICSTMGPSIQINLNGL
jgi:large subunit ribosomal protein L1